MKKRSTLAGKIKMGAGILILAAVAITINACRKNCRDTKPTPENNAAIMVPVQTSQNTLSAVYSIAGIRKSADGTTAEVFFSRNAEAFTVTDAAMIATLSTALQAGEPVRVTFNPWLKSVLQVTAPTYNERAAIIAHQAIIGNNAMKIDIDHTDAGALDNAYAVINTTTTGLTSVIPDMATAQAMFDYITHQCCADPGPYAIDFCISFQYCEDGCYARAHKMCWILNNKYHYATQKVFSFANSGNDELCVQAQKWGGCCVNWWYHVAPLVTIKTPTGPKAYVFDAAMFDQPVLLSTWLHAQQNPACVPLGDVPHVSMINVQPTTAYSPVGYSGTYFDTDPTYSSTDTTMVNYGPLVTCP